MAKEESGKSDKDLFNMSKEESFSEWYLELVRRAKLVDQRAPTKGFDVLMPNAMFIWEKIQGFLNSEFAAMGARNAYFPLVIPESLLEEEAEHFEGFIPEVAWVTHGGETSLENRLAIRPTSETIINYMFAYWIRSYQDLPLQVNQWCNVVRWETKMTKPFLRGREFLWQEGHTAWATPDGAKKNVDDALKAYRRLLTEVLKIPCMFIKRPEWDKFAGAEDTISLETLMPDGKVLQAGTAHNLGQNFSKPLNIEFLNDKNEKEFVYQTSWGVSTRLIGGLVMSHGDDHGLILPFNLAPTQVVIIPILFKGKEKPVLEKCGKIKQEVEEMGCSCVIDESDSRPGEKHYYWELNGAPLRIEVGPRDVEKKNVVLVRRDTAKKVVVKDKDLMDSIVSEAGALDKALYNKAKKLLKSGIQDATKKEEVKELIEARAGIVKIPFCSTGKDGEACAEELKEYTGGGEVRGTLYPRPEAAPKGAKCPICGKAAKELVYVAKAY